MCGIAGYFRQKEGKGGLPDIELMTGLLEHRGPDDKGYYSDEFVGLGMRRLSIIDLSTGHQPIANEDNTVWTVFNGEIYNYRELRNSLISKGHLFRTNSDTEVLVHGYEEWGEDLPLKLRGMFAFAIRDTKKDLLMLVRDHFGIKPLYYSGYQDMFIFASEIKSLLLNSEISKEVDPISLDRYLSFLYVPEPRTIYSDINALPPAHYLLLRKGNIALRQYWKFGPVLEDISETEAIRSIQEVLEDSVTAMMVSDVPLGVFLSGGLDSTSILALMAKNSKEPVKTFTVGFGGREKAWDELSAARSIAGKFGTEHHEFNIDPNVVELLPRIIRNFDQPFANPTSVILYLLAGETRRHVKVALAGTGGDEMFAGYPRYKGMLYYQQYAKLPLLLRKAAAGITQEILRDSADGSPGRQRTRRFFEGGALSFEDCYLRFITVLETKRKQDLYTSKFISALSGYDTMGFIRPYLEEQEKVPQIERLMAADMNTYLPFNQLVYGDRMSMARSLEVRVPFVDQRVVDVAGRIPLGQKIAGNVTKGLFRKAMSPFLPEAILKAPKQGLNLPIALWFRRELRDWMRSLLSTERIEARGYLKPDGVQRVIDEHISGRYDHSLFIWALIVFEIWCQQYMDHQLDKR